MTTQINVRIDDDLLARMRRYRAAHGRGLTQTSLVAWAIGEYLDARTDVRTPDITSDTYLAEMQGLPTYDLLLSVDYGRREISIQMRHESERGSRTAREHHGHADSYPIQPMSRPDWQCLLSDLLPMVEELCDLYSSDWDGSAHAVAWSDTERAEDLRARMDRVMRDHDRGDAPRGSLWSAAEWLEADPPEVPADATDGALERMATDLQGDAHADGVHLYGLDEYLCGLRDEADE